MKYAFAAVNATDWLKKGLALDKVLSCGISAVDIRVANPAAGPSKDEIELSRIVSEAGITVRCHGWAGVRGSDGSSKATAVDGTRQGRELARCAQRLGVTDLASGNFERDVWRGPVARKNSDGVPTGWYANPAAVDYIHSYISAFYELNRECSLGDLGFSDPDEHYIDADLDKDGDIDDEIPRDLVERFKRRGIMAYQNDAASVKKKLAGGRAVAGPVPLSWWGSVGRVAADGAVVGSAAVTQSVCRERASGIDEWVGYVGFGAIQQLLVGNPKHMALTLLVKQMLLADTSAT